MSNNIKLFESKKIVSNDNYLPEKTKQKHIGKGNQKMK